MFYCEGCDILNDNNITNEEQQQRNNENPVVNPVVPEIDNDDDDGNNSENESLHEEKTKQAPITTTTSTTTTNVNNATKMEIKKSKNQQPQQSNKYSISLPREIPDMFKRIKKSGNNQGGDALTTDNQWTAATDRRLPQQAEKQKSSREEEASTAAAAANLSVSFQNVTNKNLMEELKKDVEAAAALAAAHKYATAESNGASQMAINQDAAGNNLDEDLDKFNEENDIGQAISYLASSIIAKDGRELFGCRPSRRVHINCISQSYF